MLIFRILIFLFYIISAVLILPAQEKQINLENWFPFKSKNTTEPGVIGMSHWLDAPASKHGFLKFENENLVFEDGTKIKFWGTNICSRLPFVEAVRADSFVNFLSRYGINAVRFHKFTWHAYDGDHSTQLDPEKFERLDYFQAKLREKGIYYGWSHIYGHRVQPADSTNLLAYHEIKNLSYPWSHLNGSTSGMVNFAPDLQYLNIALTVNMLNHVNPYTGLRYAEDPALAFIEFQNEDNIFWAAIEKALEQAPTYRALLCRMFSEWLLKKYKNQAALEHAWGKENIPDGQTLTAGNIYPQPNHGVFDWEYKAAIKEKRRVLQHILDKMRFLYEKQLAFYKKFESAIRATGYKGILVASCWQAGSGFSHFYNLHSDYEIGMIDRHNYFGGGAGGNQLATGFVNNVTMLSHPGSGLLSTGMQQVVDRPFSFSEWMSLVPNEWTAEAAPIIAVYGMGLQGWDASFSFATDIPRFSRYLQSEWGGVYNATSPLHLGLYPVLARMVYRVDIAESPVLVTRNVHIPSLQEGILGFDEMVEQGFDEKNFKGSFSSELLAVGRIPIKFTYEFLPTILPNFSEYIDTTLKVIRSVTGKLNWHYGKQNYITINTAGTKGLVGFAPNREIKSDDWTLTTTNPFAVILITSLSKTKDLSQADEILVATIARGRNSGMAYSASGDTLTRKGKLPLLLEPVNVIIKNSSLNSCQVTVLDHDGLETDVYVPIQNGEINLNGDDYKTMYYLVRREH